MTIANFETFLGLDTADWTLVNAIATACGMVALLESAPEEGMQRTKQLELRILSAEWITPLPRADENGLRRDTLVWSGPRRLGASV